MINLLIFICHYFCVQYYYEKSQECVATVERDNDVVTDMR